MNKILFTITCMLTLSAAQAEVHDCVIDGMMYLSGDILGPVDKSECPPAFTVPSQITWISQYGKEMGPVNITGVGYREYDQAGAFEGCENLNTIDLGNVSYIGTNAFRNCRNLNTAIINSSVVNGYEYNDITVNYNAFSGCSMLISVRFTSKNCNIKLNNSAFSECSSLSEINFGENTVDLGSPYVFSGCKDLTTLEFHNVSSFLPASLDGARNLANIYIKEGDVYSTINGIIYCPNYAYHNLLFCPRGRQDEVILPDSISYKIAGKAFQNCDKITSLTIGENCIEIYANAFGNMKSLKNIIVKRKDAYFISTRAFDGETDEKDDFQYYAHTNDTDSSIFDRAVLWVPEGSKEEYSGHPIWGQFKDIRELSVTSNQHLIVNNLYIATNNGSIILTGYDHNDMVHVFAANGTLVYKGFSSEIKGLPKGLYYVTVADKTQKVVLR